MKPEKPQRKGVGKAVVFALFLAAMIALFGILAGGFVLPFFFATLAEIRRSGGWWQLASGKAAFSLALFIASLFIPALIRKIKPESAG